MKWNHLIHAGGITKVDITDKETLVDWKVGQWEKCGRTKTV